MLVPNRNYSSPAYRYGFNGMEKDDELKGSNNSYDFGGRNIYDSRTGRFNSIDPLYRKFPWYSPYLFAGNTPIMAGDESGLYPIVRGGKIVGYVIEPGQGPTQIAKDINNPATQAIFGYCLQDKVQWEEVVQQNNIYYANVGDWNDSDMYDIDNPVYKDLSSEAYIDELSLILPQDETIVIQTAKNISEPEGIIKDDIYLNIWGPESGQDNGGWAQARAKGNEKIHSVDYNAVGFARSKPTSNGGWVNALRIWVKALKFNSGDKKDKEVVKQKAEKIKVTYKIDDVTSGIKSIPVKHNPNTSVRSSKRKKDTTTYKDEMDETFKAIGKKMRINYDKYSEEHDY